MKHVRRSGLVLLGLMVTLAIPSAAEAQKKTERTDKATQLLGVNAYDTDRQVPQDIVYKAKAIANEMVCLCGTCPREPLGECDCGWAYTNRRGIQLAILDGKTREQIRKAYEDAFGLKAFGVPPNTGLGQLSYIVPYAAAVLGLAAFAVFGLRLRLRNREAVEAVEAVEPVATGSSGSDEAAKILAKELDDLD